MENRQTLGISWSAIVKVFLALLIFYILFAARDILIWFFFALVISLMLEPAINTLRWLKVPKILAVIMVYLSVFGVFGLLIYLTAPIFIFEMKQLSLHIPEYFEKLNPLLKELGIALGQNFDEFTASLVSNLQESSESIISAASVFFGGLASTAFIFTFAFFISLEDRGPERMLALLAPKKYEGYVVELFERAQSKVSGWFGARLVACLLVGIASFVVFFLFGVKYAFILAVISGALNFVPYVGPTATFILAVLFVGVSNLWLLAIYVCVALLVIQEIENKFLTPILMKRFMDLPPVLVLLSLLIGQAVFGFLGMVFAVPVFGIAYEFVKEFLERRRQEETSY